VSGQRWTTEAQVLAEMERLNDLSMEKVAEYQGLAVKAAEAEATHKALRAKRALTAKASGVKSVAEAEMTSEADPEVAQAYLDRLVLAAQADACREALRSIRTNQDGLRTAAASHRDQISGPGWSGNR
jgi:hypothetical protein